MALSSALTGCDDAEAQLRADARKFLSLHRNVSYAAAPAARETALQALESALLTEPVVQSARNLCLAGHRALLQQEREQEVNAQEVENALAAQPGDAPLPAETIARLKGRVATSEQGLARAREQLRECEANARSLELRFGAR